jgi:hypothetical protein
MTNNENNRKELFDRCSDILSEMKNLKAIIQNPVDKLTITDRKAWEAFYSVEMNKLIDWKNDVIVFLNENIK